MRKHSHLTLTTTPKLYTSTQNVYNGFVWFFPLCITHPFNQIALNLLDDFHRRWTSHGARCGSQIQDFIGNFILKNRCIQWKSSYSICFWSKKNGCLNIYSENQAHRWLKRRFVSFSFWWKTMTSLHLKNGIVLSAHSPNVLIRKLSICIRCAACLIITNSPERI